MRKAQRIRKILDELFPEVPIPLAHTDPFTLLCAVMLSAQTTDKKVNEITPRLFALAPTPEVMAATEEADILRIIRPLGLSPQKSKNLRKMAQRLVGHHDGQVPRTLEELEELAGVGHKTASVVLTQAFGVPTFPVDTHIHRLAARWGLSNGRSVEQTERDLKKLYPRKHWGKLHLQIIYFGRQYCPALRHEASGCPVCSWAARKAEGGARP